MEAYLGKLDETFTLAKQIVSESPADGWEVFDNSGGIIVETKAYSYCPVNCVRAWVKINATAEVCWNYCWNMKEADYKAIESALQRMVDLEEDENTKIRESVSALPWPIWSRKMVFFLHKIRGSMIIGAFLFEDLPEGGCKFTRILHINPNGDLPAWVINQSLGRVNNMLKCIKASVEKK